MLRSLALALAGLLAVAPTQRGRPPAARFRSATACSAPCRSPWPKTASGPLSVADLNRAAGGRPRWVLVPGDDAGDPKQAVAVARRVGRASCHRDGAGILVGRCGGRDRTGFERPDHAE
jgi:branched-chain amino acid transport system substrate-binding protein